jgi:hypothetical protein
VEGSKEESEKSPARQKDIPGVTLFTNSADFSRMVESVTGQTLDVESIVALDTDFVQAYEQYLLIDIKQHGEAISDNLLFLTPDATYICSPVPPSPEDIKNFEDIISMPFGRNTVMTFIILDKVLERHKQHLDSFIKIVLQLEDEFDHTKYRDVSVGFERLDDRLEEFHDLLLRLQERHYKQVDTQLISFDYGVLIAESLSLQGRCRRRLESLRVLRQEHDTRTTEELNQRVIKLNNVVRTLTALTVILMLPTLISSHFGMNFAFMPELKIWWAYPLAIAVQFVLMGTAYLLFKKIQWL